MTLLGKKGPAVTLLGNKGPAVTLLGTLCSVSRDITREEGACSGNRAVPLGTGSNDFGRIEIERPANSRFKCKSTAVMDYSL